MRVLVLCTLFLAGTAVVFAQSDAEKFAEGRVAMDVHHDCRAAWEAFQSVSNVGRNNPIWLFYMGKTEECLNRPAEAMNYYEQYDRRVPGQAEIINKIGELRYGVRKQKEAEDAAAAERRQAADAKQKADAQKKAYESKELADVIGETNPFQRLERLISLAERYPYNLEMTGTLKREAETSRSQIGTISARLKTLISGNFDHADYQGKQEMLRREFKSLSKCSLSYFEEYKSHGGDRWRSEYMIDFSDNRLILYPGEHDVHVTHMSQLLRGRMLYPEGNLWFAQERQANEVAFLLQRMILACRF